MNDDDVGDDMPTSAHDLTDNSRGSLSEGEAGSTTGNETMIDIETGTILAVPQRESFAEFYERERANVIRALCLSLQDDDFGTDAGDEAFVRACQNWSSVQALNNPTGWVYRVGLNWAHSALRKRRRQRAKQTIVSCSDSVTDRTPDIDLQRALAGLSDPHRSVVVCRFYLDWSVDETADALGVPPGTIKSRLSRALEHLEIQLRVTPAVSAPSGHDTDRTETGTNQ